MEARSRGFFCAISRGMRCSPPMLGNNVPILHVQGFSLVATTWSDLCLDNTIKRRAKEMNRTLIIAVLIAVLAGGYYFYSQGNSAGDMMDTASDAASGAADTVSDAASDAAGAVADTATDAAGAVTDAVEGAAETASEAMDSALFSVDSYDAVKVGDMIDASTLDENQKNGFKTALLAAADDPELLAQILSQVKEALGM